MSDKNISEYCQFVGSDKILCVYGEESVECKVIGDNKFVCGEEKKDCTIIEGHLGCEHIEEFIAVVPKGEEMKDVFIGHAYLVVVVAILSLALTQIIKPFIWKTCSEKSDAVIRLFAVLTGAGIAYHLSNPFNMIDVYLGASAGAINAFVIKMFKAKVKKSLGIDDTHEIPNKEKEDE